MTRDELRAEAEREHLAANPLADAVLELLGDVETRDGLLAMQGKELKRLDAARVAALDRCARIDDERAAVEAAYNAAEVKVERVERLHWGRLGPTRPGTCDACGEHYPCATIRTLRGDS